MVRTNEGALKSKALITIQEIGTLEDRNKAQKRLWLALVQAGYVERNDAQTFLHLADYFRNYENRHGKWPTLSHIVTAFAGR